MYRYYFQFNLNKDKDSIYFDFINKNRTGLMFRNIRPVLFYDVAKPYGCIVVYTF